MHCIPKTNGEKCLSFLNKRQNLKKTEKMP